MIRDLFTAIGAIVTAYWMAGALIDVWFWIRCPEIRKLDKEVAELRRRIKRGEF